ncbi:MerR family transcriptional regulator, mercuric resistance operon regulatory protein (plasmid) [Beijerinckiaceae bacterium RH AL1]|jgi:MerR family transcriptional regulator, mercuric resistance operon regulatory protein|nr:helix-turn-helix domain-containing protein [Beijerinckiaceae bacterium]VVB50356.1 MerR family transcriptional regulator, mercuric resistance operon regulatory protein [Beijerinckiaceae bacterium RH CH11]VVB50365.1 MerR family transcriptional regulator, mercuric resistance operon regulatory protein [Beijerinckiaceae bacterium RH AL8]VVC57367.1 MerR family transcriptional regulator, mercuric resistance operon regulatory protein [Beijerinckiaceae bacterium RH AL1]
MTSITDARAEALSIGELSRRTGVHIETIRYYEKIDMLPAPPRTDGGRRVYGNTHARTLAFVRRARELGFMLSEVRTLLDLGAPERASCAEVREIASAHLASVRTKLADLVKLEAILAGAVARCTGDATPACPVLDILDSHSADGNIPLGYARA